MSGYRLRPVVGSIFELGSVRTDPSSVRYPLKEFAKKKKNKEAVLKILDTVQHIDEIGVERAVEKKLIKRLEGDMVEIRVGGETIRAFCYHRPHGYEVVIVGIEGQTHKGGSNDSSRFIAKYKPLVEAARRFLETKGYDEDVYRK